MTRGPGFFISPRGEVIMVGTTHARTVMKDPEAFGLSRDAMGFRHMKNRRGSGFEGNPRGEILRAALRNGWIRLRRHTNRYWSVQTGTVTEERIGFVRRWAREILTGIRGCREDDPYMVVRMEGLEDGFVLESTVGELAFGTRIATSSTQGNVPPGFTP
jgi:hypothetical protein